MSGDGRFRRAFRLAVGRRDRDGLDEELAFHVERLVEELVAEGWDEEEARGEALRRFGDVASVRAECRRIDERGEGMMKMVETVDRIRQDVAFAVRQLRRHPGVSALTLLTLVIGVAATAVVFSVVDAVVLAPLPFPEPEELVRVRLVTPQGERFSVSDPNFVDLRERQRSFTELGGAGTLTLTLTEGGRAESLEGMRVSHTLLPLLGLEPVVGRNFLPLEDREGGPPVALLARGEWERRFGGDPEVLGTTLTLDGVAHEVVGVVPTRRVWPGVQLLVPLAPEPVLQRDNHMIEVYGRLAPGTTLAEARSDVGRIGRELATEYPEAMDGWGATVVPLREMAVGPRLTRLGWFLLGAVGLLLLMTCVSVANLQVARASARLREMGVRAALGAGRRRTVAQLLTESAVLGVLGAGAAIGLAYWSLPLVRRLGPADVARLSQATVDGSVLAVAVAAALLTVLASGLAPVALVLRSGVSGAMRSGAAERAGGGRRLRSALVSVQYALAVVVLLGAGLVTRSFAELRSVELGFEPEGLVRFSVRLPDTRFEREERGPFLRRMLDGIEALPEVEAAGVTMVPPFAPGRPSNFVAPSEREPDRQEDFVPVSWRAVTGDYFRAAGVRLLAGRAFGPDDRPDPEAPSLDGLPVVVDRTLADRLFPDGSDPLGRPVTWFQPGGFRMTVVGVVSPARDEYLADEPRPRIYLPYDFVGWVEPAVLVRTAGDPGALIASLRATVAELDAQVPVVEPMPVRADVRETVAWPRFTMQVLVAFGLMALLLASMGIYGVTAFSVARRRREIGVRVALGARPRGVTLVVLRRAVALAVGGIVVGLGVAVALSRFLESLLYGVSAADPVTFVAVPVALVALAVVAAWVPARRALKVDPREALVSE